MEPSALSSSDNGQHLSFAQLLARICRESALILTIAICVFLFVSLLGFDYRDSGWSHLGYQPEVRNFTGPAGAWIADIFISAIGLGAYLLPFLISVPLIRFLLKREQHALDLVPYFILRATGCILLMLAFCTLCSTHIANESLRFPFSSGGLLGESISDWAVSWFSIVGSSVVFFTLLIFGFTLVLEMGWSQLLEKLGLKVCSATEQLRPARATEEQTDEFSMDDVEESKTSASDMSFNALQSEQVEVTEPLFSKNTSVPTDSFDDQSTEYAPEEVPLVRPAEKKEMKQPVQVTEATSAKRKATPKQTNAEPDVSEKGHVRIVPLSETHKPMQDSELGLDEAAQKAAPKRRKPKLPSLDLLDPPTLNTDTGYSQDQLESMSRLLEAKLKDFGVIAEVVEVNPGPVITRFEIQPAPGVKASKITNLAKDLARSMAVSSVRVVEVIAGKSVVGIEIPNETRQTVSLSEVLSSKPYLTAPSKLTLGLGNDIAGNPVVANLAKMPHLLVAGTTGSGKSVGVNAMLLSLLFKATPDEVRLIMVDPKMLELSIYEGIPHLLTPVITDMKDAAAGLRWCVGEMERRYRLMAKMGVRNLAGFNDKLDEARKQGEPLLDPLWNAEENGEPFGAPAPELDNLPYIVVVIDEFADMMMIVGKKVEELIARIAQKARAAGIHLILATQRPSVDVITGLIKANIPTRIAFQVSSRIDSRTILDQSGAEHLLGWGDMLYLPAGTSLPNRVHGAFVSDDEVHRVVESWKQLGQPDYINEILEGDTISDGGGSASLFDDEQDPLYDEAVAFALETRKASISSVQRKLKIGYNRAARMVEAMEAAGVVSSAGTNGQREVLAPNANREM
ncbi:MAG: DNA translocase FtsK 4TM domain-containing protein [Neptuniibacter sp.]